uniref:Uncharacterized protein n=1 Tax=Globodera rostochiensis TaxID=31243 RepID=A0A914H284_GLORO
MPTVVPPPVVPKLSSSIGTGDTKFGQNRVVTGGHPEKARMPRGKHKNISIPPPAQGHIGVAGGRRMLSPSSVAEDPVRAVRVELR